MEWTALTEEHRSCTVFECIVKPFPPELRPQLLSGSSHLANDQPTVQLEHNSFVNKIRRNNPTPLDRQVKPSDWIDTVQSRVKTAHRLPIHFHPNWDSGQIFPFEIL